MTLTRIDFANKIPTTRLRSAELEAGSKGLALGFFSSSILCEITKNRHLKHNLTFLNRHTKHLLTSSKPPVNPCPKNQNLPKYYNLMKIPRNIYCKVGNIFKNVAQNKKICYNKLEFMLRKFYFFVFLFHCHCKGERNAGH